MSLCRFSSDDHQCDVYCYQDDDTGYWITHVAVRRIVFAEPLPPPVPMDTDHLDAFIARERAVVRIVETSKRVPIGLPCDGRTYSDATEALALARLRDLRTMGYRVSDYVFAADDSERKNPRSPLEGE